MLSKSFNPTDVRYEPPCHGFTPLNRYDDGVILLTLVTVLVFLLLVLMFPDESNDVEISEDVVPARRKAEGITLPINCSYLH
mmetsp:Transcript_5443/g.6114  ORF Transcript_5443/g.6114 Transcript_5443/m.6114 type:complete len:82 (+) Transcript_5443:1395-1640(+)